MYDFGEFFNQRNALENIHLSLSYLIFNIPVIQLANCLTTQKFGLYNVCEIAKTSVALTKTTLFCTSLHFVFYYHFDISKYTKKH